MSAIILAVLSQASLTFSVQTFLQWLITAIFSIASIIIGLKYGLKELQEKFDKLDSMVEKGFSNLRSDLEKMKDNQTEEIKKVAIIQHEIKESKERLQKLSEEIEELWDLAKK